MFGAILGAAGGIAKGVMGAIQAGKARKAIDNYVRQDLVNTQESRSISTMAQEYAQEQLAMSAATAMQGIQASGVRGVVGATPKIVASAVDSAQKVGAQIDEKQMQLDKEIAADEARIQGMQERREEADLAGLGQQLSVGQQNMFSGIGDVAGGVSSFMAQGKANKAGSAWKDFFAAYKE
jgi:hypothetical protein